MRITGTLHKITPIKVGDIILPCVVIPISNDDASTAFDLIDATVDIYPHPVDGLAPGQCTPENYAHALARLAHAEDHLAREVRSSQALIKQVRDLEAGIAARNRGLVNADGMIAELVRRADALRQQASDMTMEIEGLRAGSTRECIHDALARLDEEG